MNIKCRKIENIDLPEGFILSGKFEILGKLGGGWEGEVYSICEISTGIERAAKSFYPQRNIRNSAAQILRQKTPQT